MQFDCRAPQFVTQIDRNERSGFFLQFAMQVVCSSLQRMGTATAVWGQSRISRVAAMQTNRPRSKFGESAGVISPVYERLRPGGNSVPHANRSAIPLLAHIVHD